MWIFETILAKLPTLPISSILAKLCKELNECNENYTINNFNKMTIWDQNITDFFESKKKKCAQHILRNQYVSNILSNFYAICTIDACTHIYTNTKSKKYSR